MLLFINLSKKPASLQYAAGTDAYKRQIPQNCFVAYKNLENPGQVKNLASLKEQGVSVYHYEPGTFVHKANDFNMPTNLFSGTTTASGMTFTVANVNPTRAFLFVTSANTVMANNTVSANTIGGNYYISFSGAVTTTNWLGALNATSFSGSGIGVTGTGSSPIGAATLTLSAGTLTALASRVPNDENGNTMQFLYVPNNAKPSQYAKFAATSTTIGFAALKARI